MTSRTLRATRADGERTRQAILQTAARLATVEGLEGLSIGRLAEEIGMSKSGLYAHFGSKEELQLATIALAGEIFDAEVIQPVKAADSPVDYVIALCDSYLDHLARRVFPGGCFFARAAAELEARPGPLQQQVAAKYSGWMTLLRQHLEAAQRRREIDLAEDAAQVAFELDAFLLVANLNFVLFNDPVALDRARHAVRSRLARAGARLSGAPAPATSLRSAASE